MTIVDRMAAAIAKLHRLTPRRSPKAFYLCEKDWTAFMATSPSSGRFPWGNNPTVWREEPAFDHVPVRQSKSATVASRLYDNTTSARMLPKDDAP